MIPRLQYREYTQYTVQCTVGPVHDIFYIFDFIKSTVLQYEQSTVLYSTGTYIMCTMIVLR